MRDPYQRPLITRPRDGLDRRKPRRDRRLEEQADQVALESLDLLAHDYRQLGRGKIPGLERHVDPIMIRDREMREPPGVRRLDDVPRIRQAVEASPRVAMQIRKCPSHVRRVAPGPASGWVPSGGVPNGAQP